MLSPKYLPTSTSLPLSNILVTLYSSVYESYISVLFLFIYLFFYDSDTQRERERGAETQAEGGIRAVVLDGSLLEKGVLVVVVVFH